MSYKAVAYKVLIASPSDVEPERATIREVIGRWNNVHSERRKLVLMPIGWETHSSPEMGDRPQSILNKQLASSCDLLIGVFWTRIGTPTASFASGSVEEIENHMKAGLPTMIYFSTAPVEYGSVDRDQYDKLMEFKASCRDRGVYNDYRDLNDFRQKLNDHLQLKLNEDRFAGFEQANHDKVISAAPGTNVPKLSREAQMLLIEAVQGDGKILCIPFLAGTAVQAAGKRFTDNTPRSTAIWEGSVNELEQYGLVRTPGLKREIFTVTRLGYEVAQSLRS